MTIETRYSDLGDSAAREDIRNGNTCPVEDVDDGAVLHHLGLDDGGREARAILHDAAERAERDGCPDDGADALEAARAAALRGYREAMEAAVDDETRGERDFRDGVGYDPSRSQPWRDGWAREQRAHDDRIARRTTAEDATTGAHVTCGYDGRPHCTDEYVYDRGRGFRAQAVTMRGTLDDVIARWSDDRSRVGASDEIRDASDRVVARVEPVFADVHGARQPVEYRMTKIA